jgi:twitching motility two-component system response regulator PilG
MPLPENEPDTDPGKTILVVDDSPVVRNLIAGKLQESGYNVLSAANGAEALAVISNATPDLVLLDIAMPKMDGYQVCENIRKNGATKNIPVVLISGKDGYYDENRAQMAGTSSYISKPFGPETLMKALETYLPSA